MKACLTKTIDLTDENGKTERRNRFSALPWRGKMTDVSITNVYIRPLATP